MFFFRKTSTRFIHFYPPFPAVRVLLAKNAPKTRTLVSCTYRNISSLQTNSFSFKEYSCVFKFNYRTRCLVSISSMSHTILTLSHIKKITRIFVLRFRASTLSNVNKFQLRFNSVVMTPWTLINANSVDGTWSNSYRWIVFLIPVLFLLRCRRRNQMPAEKKTIDTVSVFDNLMSSAVKRSTMIIYYRMIRPTVTADALYNSQNWFADRLMLPIRIRNTNWFKWRAIMNTSRQKRKHFAGCWIVRPEITHLQTRFSQQKKKPERAIVIRYFMPKTVCQFIIIYLW